jgi:hypothetical protein
MTTTANRRQGRNGRAASPQKGSDSHAVRQGATLAGRALRAVADAGESERLATALPLVIEQLCGVDVAIECFAEGLDSLAWCRDGFRLILVSNALSWTRQRFTLVHELTHVLAGNAQDLRVDLDVISHWPAVMSARGYR